MGIKKGETKVLKHPPKLKMPTVKTKLTQELIDDLANAGTDGETVEMWCVRQKISKDSFYSWCKGSAEFAEARQLHRKNLESFWQKLGMKITVGQVKNANATTYVWLTKNILNWRDKVEQITTDDEVQFED